MKYIYTSELYHHGIKGQRWGVRRFQNADGTLTNAGKKRYDKLMSKFHKQYSRDYSSKIELKSYNKTADYMNAVGIKKFNEKYWKGQKEGTEEYRKFVEKYEKYFQDHLNKNLDRTIESYKKNNRYYRKAQELVSKKKNNG